MHTFEFFYPAVQRVDPANPFSDDALFKALDSRRSPRVAFRTAVVLSSIWGSYSGLSVNLSDGGIFVAIRHLPAPGAEVALSFSLPGGLAVMARGFVRWCRETSDATRGVGIEFHDMSVQHRKAVHAFISQSHVASGKRSWTFSTCSR